MTVSKFLDSSAWLSYFFADNKEIKSILDESSLIMTSVISIFEIKKKLLKEKIHELEIKEAIDFMKKRSIILDLTREICEEAALISLKNKLHAIDSLIYASAMINKMELVTGDKDFMGMKNIKILDR